MTTNEDNTIMMMQLYPQQQQYYNNYSTIASDEDVYSTVFSSYYHQYYTNNNDTNTNDIQVNTTTTTKKLTSASESSSSSNSPCSTNSNSSMSIESSNCYDEGYVGSFNEHHHHSPSIKQQQQQQVVMDQVDDDEEVATATTTADVDFNDYLNNFNLNELPYYLYDYTIDFDTSKLTKVYEFYDEKEEMVSSQCVEKQQQTCFSHDDELFYDDYVDITAYLYEIDLNQDYYSQDNDDDDHHHHHNDNDDDDELTTMLHFENKYEACNLRQYSQNLDEYLRFHSSSHSTQPSTETAIEYLDYIPEFVPSNDNDCGSGGEGFGLVDDLDQTLIDQQYTGDIFDNVYTVYSTANTCTETSTATYNNDVESEYGGSEFSQLDDCDSRSSTSGYPIHTKRYHKISTTSTTASTTNRDFRKPCVYMLNDGQCLRADCRFAHDLHNITCKYWLEGECLKGDACEFLHSYVDYNNCGTTTTLDGSTTESSTPTGSVSSASSSSTSFGGGSYHYSSKLLKKHAKQQHQSSKRQQIKQDFNLNTEDFPDLGLAATTTTTITAKVVTNDVENKQIDINTKPPTSAKKSRKFKDNILVSLSLPALTNSSRKKHIN